MKRDADTVIIHLEKQTALALYDSCKETCDYSYLVSEFDFNQTSNIHTNWTIITGDVDVPGVNFTAKTAVVRVGANPDTNASLSVPLLESCGHDLYSCNCYNGYPL
jgi:hypothetical protein